MTYPAPIQKLIDLFTKFPGIGPRQATRFAFFLSKNPAVTEAIAEALGEMSIVMPCILCFRAMEKNDSGLCAICSDTKRDQEIIAVVEKESDMQNLEKTSVFRGVYHILGGSISPLDNDSPKRLHLRDLYERVKSQLTSQKKTEVILATNSTTEGDMTALYIERILSPLQKEFPGLARQNFAEQNLGGLTITRLGRGLSLGAELEYADEVTLKNALTNRK